MNKIKKRESCHPEGYGGEIITTLPKDWDKNLVITKPTMVSKEEVKLREYFSKASLMAKKLEFSTIDIAKMLQLESLIITLEELLNMEKVKRIIREACNEKET